MDIGEQLKIVTNYIEENIFEELTVEVLSALTTYTPPQFEEIFRNTLGMSLSKYMRKCRFLILSAMAIERGFPVNLIYVLIVYRQVDKAKAMLDYK